jgi:signal transduction histidine kinase
MKTPTSIEALEAKLQGLAPSSIAYVDAANALSLALLDNHLDAERAHRLATQAHALCTGPLADHRKGRAESLINLAFHQADRHDLPEALRLILQAGTIAADLQDAEVSFRQLKIHRFICALMNDHNSAIAVSFERMALARKLGDLDEEVSALQALVHDLHSVDDHAQALAFSEKALALAARLGDQAALAHSHMYHTYPLRKLGRLDLALDHGLKAYGFYQGQANRVEVFCLGILGSVHLEMGEHEKSRACFARAGEILRTLDNPYLIAYNHCETGMVDLATGRIAEAIAALQRGIGWAESQGSQSLLLENYLHLIEAHKANQDFEQALLVFEKLAALRAEVHSSQVTNQRNALLVRQETEQARLAAQIQQERADRLHAEADALARQNAMIQKIDALKNDRVATASHDIRSPLTSMTMDLDTLGDIAAGIPGAQDCIDRLLKNVERVADLIEDLRDFSRNQGMARLQTMRCDLTALVQEALLRHRPLARAKAIDLSSTLPAQPLMAELDARQFDRVLDNLIGNALKYTGEQGTVGVTLEAADGRARLGVRDSGRGIPADELAHVFESRFRASNSQDQKGEGHGLSIVRTIVEAHRGQVVCDSRLGAGSVFTVSLPVPDGPAPAA